MQEEELTSINETYFQLLEQQVFDTDTLDYTILDHHKQILERLAKIGNSAVSVFDLYKKQHVFHSFNIGTILGFEDREVGERFLDSKIHPTDYTTLVRNGIRLLKFFENIPINEKADYKLICEFRILNSDNNYIRVIEQHQALEVTSNGSLWLALSILDLSPNQKNINEGLTYELLNFRTGKIIPFIKANEETNIILTKREKEVLKLVKAGFLSKEISDKLIISLHTVNTHRQRVLEKLGVANSMEAVMLASRLGLI